MFILAVLTMLQLNQPVFQPNNYYFLITTDFSAWRNGPQIDRITGFESLEQCKLDQLVIVEALKQNVVFVGECRKEE